MRNMVRLPESLAQPCTARSGAFERPVHRDGTAAFVHLDPDVGRGAGPALNRWQGLRRMFQGDRHERLGPQQQGCAFLFVQLAVDNVGVDAMGQRNPGN